MENSSESNVANGTVTATEEAQASDPAPPGDSVTKPVNPLRLARPLEKSPVGLNKTAFSPGRPMPMPTINPLCPPGSNQGKNGLKPSATSPVGKNKQDSQEEPGSQAGRDNVKETESVNEPTEKKDATDEPKSEAAEVLEKTDAKDQTVTPEDTPEEETKSGAPVNTDKTETVSASQDKTEDPSEKSKVEPEPAEKSPEKSVATPTRKDSPSENKKKVEGPKIPVAEKTPRQPKRKKSQEVEALGDDEKRTSKRSRAPPEVYKSPDPEMAHILKTIKKQEEEAKKSTGKNGTSDEEKEKPSDLKKRKSEDTKPSTKSTKTNGKKRKKKVEESESEEEFVEPEDESEDDDDYKPVKIKKTPPRKPIRKSKVNIENSSPKKKSGKKDPVFFKDEYLAVRNDEGSFYLCKAMQNIYIGSRNITIQWLSNEEHIIPPKDNPKHDIYAPDFYDKTEFETILTSVELDKVLGKSKRVILPEEELTRIKKILQRSNEKAEGKLDMSNFELNEDNPDGLDISLYKGEDQLDEIEKRRTEKEKTPKRTSNVSKSKTEEEENSCDVVSDSKKGRGRPKKEAASEGEGQQEVKPESDPAGTGSISRREKRKASKNMSYDQFDFLEEDDDEVMPAPKKRKSQDSVTSGEEKTKDKKEADPEEGEEGLSTSERAIIKAEKAEDKTTSSTEPVKKRGRKPKTKE